VAVTTRTREDTDLDATLSGLMQDFCVAQSRSGARKTLQQSSETFADS